MIVETGVEGVRSAGVPVKMGRTPGSIRRPAPRLGADDERLSAAHAWPRPGVTAS
jgi:hypothetical protein